MTAKRCRRRQILQAGAVPPKELRTELESVVDIKRYGDGVEGGQSQDKAQAHMEVRRNRKCELAVGDQPKPTTIAAVKQ